MEPPAVALPGAEGEDSLDTNAIGYQYGLQKVKITAFIRHILDQYQFGLQILVEFIQNADDAQAQQIDIGVDERDHRPAPGTRLPGNERAADLLGPALVVLNDQEFSEQDFANITNTGDSGKRGDASKTGRFCLGVNTAFHLGDCFLLVTGARMVAFDPARLFFPEPFCVEFGEHNQTFADEHPEFCAPFSVYGVDFRSHFCGTIFRIPLRTQQLPGSMAKRVVTPADLWAGLLDEFCQRAGQALLFLKHLRAICVHVVPAGGSNIRKSVFRASLEGEEANRDFLHMRTQILNQLLFDPTTNTKLDAEGFRSKMIQLAQMPPDQLPQNMSRIIINSVRRRVASRSVWLLCTRVAAGEALRMAAEDPDALMDRRIPLVQAAACEWRDNHFLPAIDGRVHCALPLMDERGHTMHLNLFAPTTPDRRKLLRSDDKQVHAWEVALLKEGVAHAVAAVLELCARRVHTNSTRDPLDSTSTYLPHLEHESEAQVGRRYSIKEMHPNIGTDSEADTAKKGQGTGDGQLGEEVAPWYALFPRSTDTTSGDALLAELQRSVYAAARNRPVLRGVTRLLRTPEVSSGTRDRVGKNGGSGTKVANDVDVVELCTPADNTLHLDRGALPRGSHPIFKEVVLRCTSTGLRLVEPTRTMLDGFLLAESPLTTLTPGVLRGVLRDPPALLLEWLAQSDDAYFVCLDYMLSDSQPDLTGVWAARTLDGKMRAFASPLSPPSLRIPQQVKDPDHQWRLAMNAATPHAPSVSTLEQADAKESPSAATTAAPVSVFYLASADQRSLLQHVLGARLLNLSAQLDERMVKRLTASANVVVLDRAPSQMGRLLHLLLPSPVPATGLHAEEPNSPPKRARHVARASLELTPLVPFHINVDVQMEQSEPPHQEPPCCGEADAVECARQVWRHLSTYADLEVDDVPALLPLLPTRRGGLVALGPEHMRFCFFDMADVAFLEEPDLDLLERLGCCFVDCETNCVPRAVRRLRRPLAGMVEVIAPRVPAVMEQQDDDSGNDTGWGLITILAKIHRRIELVPAKLHKVASWSMFQVLDNNCKPIWRSVAAASAPTLTDAESDRPRSTHDSQAVPLYMMEDDKVDVRLLPSHTFLNGGGKTTYTSEVHWFLKELGVKAIPEMQFYSEFLIPHLATNFARTSSGDDRIQLVVDFLELVLPRIEHVLSAEAFTAAIETLSDCPFVPTEVNGTIPCTVAGENSMSPAPKAVCDSASTTPTTSASRDPLSTHFASPKHLRDPSNEFCRTLLDQSHFPAHQLTQRQGCMHALQRLGLAAAVSDEELRELCPHQWREEEEVGAAMATVWTPGESGHPTLAQLYAMWQLATTSQRQVLCWVPTVGGTLLRGTKLGSVFLLPAVSSGGEVLVSEATLTQLDCHVLHAKPPFDFSQVRGGSVPQFVLLLPQTLLEHLTLSGRNTLVSQLGKKEMCDLRQFLLLPLRPEASLSAPSAAPSIVGAREQDASTQMVQVESVAVRRRRSLWQVAALPLHPQLKLDPGSTTDTGKVSIVYAALHDNLKFDTEASGWGVGVLQEEVEQPQECSSEDCFGASDSPDVDLGKMHSTPMAASARAPAFSAQWMTIDDTVAELMLPEVVEISQLKLAAMPPGLAWYYSELKIVHARSLAALYAMAVAPSSEFAELSDTRRAKHMAVVCERRLLENPVYGKPLSAALRSVAVVHDPAESKMLRASEFVDNRHKTLATIFTPGLSQISSPKLLPTFAAGHKPCMQCLKKLGLHTGVETFDMFLLCAKRLSHVAARAAKCAPTPSPRASDSPAKSPCNAAADKATEGRTNSNMPSEVELVEAGVFLLQELVKFKDQEDLLARVAHVAFVPAARNKKWMPNTLAVGSESGWLRTINELSPPSLANVLCLVQPCLHPSAAEAIPNTLASKLWPEADSNWGEQVQRALEQMKCLRELLGTLEPTNLPPKRRTMLEGMVESLYEWLDRVIRKMHVKSSDCRGYLVPQLRKSASVFIRSLHAFVSPTIAFRNIVATAPGLMHKVDESLSKHNALLEEMGVSDRPNGVQLLGMLRTLDKQDASVRTAELSVVVLRQVVHDPGLLNVKFLNELLVPDSSLELHPLPRVLINDASWMVPRIESQKVKLAWRGLGDLRHVSSSLRMRKLSEAVEETLERSKMGADGVEHPQLSALLRGLTSRVSEEPTPPIRHRFLWLLDQQLASDALQERQEQLDASRPPAGSVASHQRPPLWWDPVEFCKKLKHLPTRVVVVERIISRFEFLEAVGVPPMAAPECSGTPGKATPARGGDESANDKASSSSYCQTKRESASRAAGAQSRFSQAASDADCKSEAEQWRDGEEAPAAEEAELEAWRQTLRRWDVTNPRARCQSQMLCCHEDATVYVGRELLESMPAVMHAKLAEVINEQLGQPLSERFVRVLASLFSCPTEDLMATALLHLQVSDADNAQNTPSKGGPGCVSWGKSQDCSQNTSECSLADDTSISIDAELLRGATNPGDFLDPESSKQLFCGMLDPWRIKVGDKLAWKIEELHEKTQDYQTSRRLFEDTSPTSLAEEQASNSFKFPSSTDMAQLLEPLHYHISRYAIGVVRHVYPYAGLVTMTTGSECQERLLHMKEIWWKGPSPYVLSDNQSALTTELLDDEDEEEESTRQRTSEADHYENNKGHENVNANLPSTETPATEIPDAPGPELDFQAEISKIQSEVEEAESQLEGEKKRRIRQLERQVEQEYREKMRKFMKKLLLKWHPDKLRQQLGVGQLGVQVEETELYLTEISQEINRLMEKYNA